MPLRHVEQQKNVAMFVTDIQCRPAGRLHGPMVVSMRWIPESLVDIAHKVTALMPSVHGSPVGAGDPRMLGIEDYTRRTSGTPSSPNVVTCRCSGRAA